MNALKPHVSEMSFIYRRGLLQNKSKETICPILAPGGDAKPANLHCRLCGATGHLHIISDDHVDETLQAHFGFMTRPTGYICSSCKNYLRITVGFSALVEATLRGSNSKSRDLLENADTLTNTSSMNTNILSALTPGKTHLGKSNQAILSLLQSSVTDPRKRRRRMLNVKKSPTVLRKRVITQCVQCGHKYPAMVRSDSVLKYVCSRCNQKNQIKEGKIKGTLDNQKRFNLKGNTRLNSLSKTTQPVKPITPLKTRRVPKTSPKELSPKTRQVVTWDNKVTNNLTRHGVKYGRYLEQPILNIHETSHTKNVWH